MKVAVTGASGFIGRHVLAELGRRGVETAAVVLSSGELRDLPAGAREVQLDIASPGPDCFSRLGRPDALIHLAWAGLPNYKSRHHFEEELPRQYSFLRQLVEAGLPALLTAGTCFEYGMQEGELSEETPPRPANPYGFAKDALRRQLMFLKADKPFKFTWARLFYLFGEGQPGTSIYPQLKAAAARGEKTFNMSGGEQLRDYLHVGEAARILTELALAGADNGIVNVCSGKPVAVRALVERWIEENKWDISPNLGHYPYPDYEPMAFWGSPAKLKRTIKE